MKRRHASDVIGSVPARDPLQGLPLFSAPAVSEAVDVSGALDVSLDVSETPDLPRPIADPTEPSSRRIAPPPLDPVKNRFTARDIERKRIIEDIRGRVVQDVLTLARSRRDAEHNPGITADDVNEIVRKEPLAATLGGEQRAMSWTGPWLSLLAKRGLLSPFRLQGLQVTRRSTREGSHGNAQAVYLDPQDRRAARQQGAA